MQTSPTGISNSRAIRRGGEEAFSGPRVPDGFLAPRPSLEGGFTLLELIATLFIVSLLVAIILPSFLGHEEKELKSEARRIASVLRYLNDSSISSKKTYHLKVNLQQDTISWKGPKGERTEEFRSLASIELESKGEVREGEVIVFFGPLGIQENLAIHLREKGKGMIVGLNSMSGRVKIIPETT